MPCWDNCGYTWRAIGESTSCIRNINDGTVDSGRLTVEIIDVRYDTGCVEPCYHEFDAIVKIYQLYDGDAFETLVYENIDTFNYNSGKVYYKYNEWEVFFNDIRESPSEVNIIIKHKELCPGCTHPYICDCEDTIRVEESSWTCAPAATNNPDTEWIYVKLLDVESNCSSARVEIEIWRDGGMVYTDVSAIINNGSYIDISDSSTEHDWRVACNDISIGGGSATTATVQLCFNFNNSGGGSGSTGDGLIAAQYYDSTTFGWTCGCLIYAETDNPRSSSEGKNTAPTEIRLDIHQWQGTYLPTKGTIPLVTQTILTPTEKAQNQKYWIPFMWDTELPPGEYMWVITCLRGPHDGSFNLIYVNYDDAQRDEAFVNGYSHRDFYSRIIGVTSNETYQKVLSENDTFDVYECTNGHSAIKVKSSDGSYNGAMTTEKGSNDICYMPCHMSTGTNLSFEEPDLAGWTVIATGSAEATRSTHWSSCGSASAKLYIPENSYDSVYIYQTFAFTDCIGTHTLWFTYFLFTNSSLWFKVTINGIVKYSINSPTAGLYSVNIPNLPSNFWIKFEMLAPGATGCRSIYIDCISFSGGADYSMAPIGRVVGGSVVRTDV